MELKRKSKYSKFKKYLTLIIAIVIVGGGVFLGMTYLENTPPEAAIHGDIDYLGKNTTISISADDAKTGLKEVKLLLRQKGQEHVLFAEEFPRKSYTDVIGEPSFQREVEIDLEKEKLEEGEATLVLQASDYSLRHGFSGNVTEITKDFIVDTKPPEVHVLHTERYIGPGCSGLVIYRLKGEAASHGVIIGGHFHKGYPAGIGKEDVYVAYIALPYTETSIVGAQVIAEDKAGNKTTLPISPLFSKTVQKHDKINISDGFLNEKLPEFLQHYPEAKGSDIEKYIYINNVIRKQNNEKISEICSTSGDERLWQGRFLRMAGATRAGFADHRTYYYNGEAIDKQVHLGIDLASTRHAEVKAANRGKVVFADYLGLYGNMVILDHGQGVFSLYSHLSQIQSSVGDILEKGAILGHTGKSGMAGGDHLHFSILINGIFVTPKEWWDPQWIEVTIDTPLKNEAF